ncbi:glycoside hydrolase family 68 protein [Parerythrobacter lacustris]|uniref:Glycoside hydrolase family 68 protein n=1 Tax=Parerythrobacter lacustris TaxID=2969984 RepID=A0ABT1XTW1_9SPHN|nr:glycoside hydrolase family 68 protein [Parerythrobacter lacustris]MCR2834346.1 glycoside hydrolase family 68 protein [Parerythrobacter lacustris]
MHLRPFGAADVVPIVPELDLWDSWPLQHEDGSTVTIDGAQFWFFLSSAKYDDPGHRHFHARIRLMRVKDGAWTDCGNAIPDALSPGEAEWAGSCVLHDDAASVTLFFTAAGRKGEGRSFEQRIFATRGTMGPDGPGGWQQPEELFAADGTTYMPANQPEGAPGAIKAFRDPAWFRDPADGQAYLLFTGSAGWDASPHNGLVGHAAMTADRWELRRPLLHAVGVNNEMERPHVLVRDGRYYLFWSTQRHTFAPGVHAGPNGLYCAVADRLSGPWTPVNGDGLVATNPAEEPTQAYSWWVTGEGVVWSFIDHWGMQGRSFATHPETLRAQFGGTPAPTFSLAFDGSSVTIV